MIKQFVLNYASTGLDADSLLIWNGGEVTVEYQLGENDRDGVPAGAVKGDGTQWLSLGTIVSAQVKTTAMNTVFMYLGGDADFAPTAYIRFRFSDATPNTKSSNWVPINFQEKPVAYFIMEDTVNSIGITCWVEAVT